MNRPYIICHILSALDGKIAGDFMSTGGCGHDSVRQPFAESFG